MTLMQRLRALLQRQRGHSDCAASNRTDADRVSTTASGDNPSATHLQTGQPPLCKCVAEWDYDATPRSEELPGRSVDLPIAFDPYRPAPKRSAFEIRLDAARHPRRRRHHKMNFSAPPPQASNSYLDSVLCQLAEVSPYSVRNSPCRSSPYKPAYDAIDAAQGLTQAGLMVAAAIVADGYVAVRDKINERAERASHEAALAKRRKYYAAEVAKRRTAAAELRAAVPSPENPRPSPEQLLEAYRHRHDDEAAKLYFGRLMIDLEEHERLTLRISGNKITGVGGGVRDWLEQNCPELAHHYHTCQRFKRMVQEDPRQPESEV